MGMSLEYLQERVGRVSGEQVLRNCVDQSTMDLEAKAESSRSGPRENYWHLQPEGLVG